MSAAAPQAARSKPARRSRKRRRRQGSYAVSSDSDSDSDSDEGESNSGAGPSNAVKASAQDAASSSSDSSDSSSDSSSSSSSDSDSDSDDSDSDSSSSASSSRPAKGAARAPGFETDDVPARRRIEKIRDNSPTPPPVAIPSFLSQVKQAASVEDGQKARFKRVYMEKLVEGFASDLDRLRTSDPTMNPTRLKRLIAALEDGSEIYNGVAAGSGKGQGGEKTVDEVAVVLGSG